MIEDFTKDDCNIVCEVSYITGYCSIAYDNDKMLNKRLQKLSKLIWEHYGLEIEKKC